MKLKIKVIPGAKKEVIIEEKDESGNLLLKIKTQKPPQDGKANESIISMLADHFKVKKNAIRIISGETSRNKVIEIEK